MAPSATAACWLGLAVALSSCGLAVSGAASDGVSSVDDGSSGNGSSSSSSSSSGAAGYNLDSALPGDDGGSSSADAWVLGPLPDVQVDSRALPGTALQDADVDAASYCAALNACCGLLASYGASSSSVTSCLSAAASGSSSTCATVLLSIQSAFLCL